eukprot:768745-Hanusia_phi.AAC.3
MLSNIHLLHRGVVSSKVMSLELKKLNIFTAPGISGPGPPGSEAQPRYRTPGLGTREECSATVAS